MMRISLILSLLVFAVTFGCTDNEQSFYVEHMKAPPDPPECVTSIGDAKTSALGINLMLAGAPSNSFQATNALISREDYGNLRAESNGIMIEGYELYTTVPGMGIVGGTEYFEYNMYLASETTDLVHATVMTSATTSFLREYFDCDYYPTGMIADAIFYTNYRDMLVFRGEEVPPEVAAGAASGETLLADLISTDPIPEIMYSNLRFLGHTQGGKEVETPEFTVVIHPSCGVKGGWESCINDVCIAFCSDEASFPETCDDGVNVRASCSDYLAEYSYMISSQEIDPTTGELVVEHEEICDYYDCP